MVKTYQEVNREHHEREREEHHERKHRKYTLLITVALLVAFVGIMLAQNAQDTADVNNVFEIVVNNTNLAPSVAGHPPGTGERVSGTTYWANDSPIEIFVFAHAMAVGDNAEIHLFINGTKVADTSGRPLGGAESSNKTIIAIIPKFSNYSVEFTNFHHYEWREYPILSGKNGTLSINQSFVGSSFNSTYDAYGSSKVNKSGDNMTGPLGFKNASTGQYMVLIDEVNTNLWGYKLYDQHGNLTGEFADSGRDDATQNNWLHYSINLYNNGSWQKVNTSQSAALIQLQSRDYGASITMYTSAASANPVSNFVERLVIDTNISGAPIIKLSNSNVSLIAGYGVILRSPDGTKCGFLNWTNANTFATTAITCP